MRQGGDSYNNYSATRYPNLYDTRIVVTATIPTEVTTVTEVTEATVQETTTTIQNAEIKNLSTIKIGFRYSF